jgi:hypothetical protein
MFAFRTRAAVLLAGAGVLLPAAAVSQQQIPLSSRALKPMPVAETRLLMEGIAQANFNGLEKLLKGKPEDNEAWSFARGQALLIAETGNLLLMRPPKNEGQDAWSKNAVELRDAATRLARSTADRDLNGSRTRLMEVANVCNKCHQSFGVKTRLSPFPPEKKPMAAPP